MNKQGHDLYLKKSRELNKNIRRQDIKIPFWTIPPWTGLPHPVPWLKFQHPDLSTTDTGLLDLQHLASSKEFYSDCFQLKIGQASVI